MLYLREVNSFLALVCLVREENFKKQGLIDYNIDSFKGALAEVIKISKFASMRAGNHNMGPSALPPRDRGDRGPDVGEGAGK